MLMQLASKRHGAAVGRDRTVAGLRVLSVRDLINRILAHLVVVDVHQRVIHVHHGEEVGDRSIDRESRGGGAADARNDVRDRCRDRGAREVVGLARRRRPGDGLGGAALRIADARGRKSFSRLDQVALHVVHRSAQILLQIGHVRDAFVSVLRVDQHLQRYAHHRHQDGHRDHQFQQRESALAPHRCSLPLRHLHGLRFLVPGHRSDRPGVSF